MTSFDRDQARPSSNDVAMLADESLFARRLEVFGPKGEGTVVLGLLRDVCDMLCAPEGRQQPFVIAQAMCRVAIERLMEIGGTTSRHYLQQTRRLPAPSRRSSRRQVRARPRPRWTAFSRPWTPFQSFPER
ncbi:hypothetical protein [Streptomyces sp. NPDC054838]